ncbi:UNVERIFIED_CONTAM: hypothetical protein Slati_0014700 [Sesamum latifolium]|uniref:Uncharacterized protein n=1 Tax=Sesamum latifolium TaxID=2727402 RepID=A0AAW2Y6P0_9LAMI
MTVDPTVNSSSSTKRTGSNSRKRKVTDTNYDIPKLVEMVSTFCESANTCLGTLTRVLENEFGNSDQRVVVLQHVRELEAFDDNKNLMVANRLVKDLKELGFFLGLSKDFRINWVRLMLADKV